MSALPRGVTQVLWKNKTKSKEKQVKFRVRVNKKVNGEPFKLDQLCDTLEEAKDLLATCHSNLGRQTLNKIDLDQSEKAKRVADLIASPPLSFYIKQYIEQNIPEMEDNDLKRRNRAAKLIFLQDNCGNPHTRSSPRDCPASSASWWPLGTNGTEDDCK